MEKVVASDPAVFGDICIVVQGLFEVSDSIGYDAVYQYKRISQLFPQRTVRLYAERFLPERYPDLPIIDVKEISSQLNDTAVIIYHYCDGWDWFEGVFLAHKGRKILRWHNNTPPWFYAKASVRLVKRTVLGIRNVVRLLSVPDVELWVNSKFTSRQAKVLVPGLSNVHVVYPAGPILDLFSEHDGATKFNGVSRGDHHIEEISILFVGRIVAHKGHKHVIKLAQQLSQFLNRDVETVFPGRSDGSSSNFNREVMELVRESPTKIVFPGEVDNSELLRYFSNATVYVSMSEHEGFGMPVFEAMLRGVPLVCWRNSALDELLDGHPLCVPEFDPVAFVAALSVAIERENYHDLSVIQGAFLTKYSNRVINGQISAALDRASPFDHEAEVERPFKSVEFLCAKVNIEARLAEARAKVEACIGLSLRFEPFDFSGNLISHYDLELCDVLLALDGTNSSSLHTPSSMHKAKASSFIVSAVELSGKMVDSLTNDFAVFDLAVGEGHVLFGPYMSLPQGRFLATFLVEGVRIEGQGHIVLDVFSATLGTLARRDFVAGTAEVAWFVEFSLMQSVTDIEFRVRLLDNVSIKGRFRGVALERLLSVSDLDPKYLPKNMSAHLADAGVARSDYPRDRHIERSSSPLQRVLSALSAVGSRSQSRDEVEAFRLADKYRDAKEWHLAAQAYSSALQRFPKNAAYWVQLGNVSKEAGEFTVSERAYFRALELARRDPEVFLQLGHLRKRENRLSEAEYYYFVAAMLSKASVDAAFELEGLGLKLERLRALLSG